MSNQFYKYLSNKLIDFFEKEGILRGSKFFVLFDEKERLIKFDNALKEIGKNKSIYSEFKFIHPISKKEYNTYSLKINGKKVVIANSLNATSSFIVGLRNYVGDPIADLEDSSLLILYYKSIDSIENATRDLQKEGMPLSIKNISKNLDMDINNSSKLSSSSKEIIKFFLSNQINDFYENTLWDYETILSIIEKGHIDEKDMISMGLFVDDELEKTNSKETIKQRLNENFNYFNKIMSYSHLDTESKENELKKMFTEDMVKVLTDENWQQTRWSEVKKSIEDSRPGKYPRYKPNKEKITKNKLHYWEKPEKDTIAGKRKWNIIIFNNKGLKKVSLDFKFDRELDRKFLKEGLDDCRISNEFINLSFNVSPSSPTYKKIIYSHKNKTTSTYEFNIVALNAEKEMFKSIKTRYFVNIKEKFIKIVNDLDDDEIVFGNTPNPRPETIDEKDQKVHLDKSESIVISEDSLSWEEDSLSFILHYNNNDIRFLIEEKTNSERSFKKSSEIWNLKRKNKENVTFDGNRAFQDTNVFNLEDKFKDYLEFERQIIEKNIFYANVNTDGSLKKIETSYSEDLKNDYLNILNYYKTNDNSTLDKFPSLTYLNDDLKILYRNFIDKFNREISEIEEGIHLNDLKNKRDLIKLGRIDSKDTIMYSPLSPINIAYQLEISEQCENEEIYKNMLETLVPNNLIPYIYSDEDGSLFKPTYQKEAHEWIIYKNINNVSISTTAFISNLVFEKLNEFVEHFDYLFYNSSAPMKINLINIKNDKYVVSGVFKFIRNRLSDKDNGKIIPLEIHIYNDNEKSSFDDLFKFNSKIQIKNEFDVKIKSDNLDDRDIIHSVQDNIKYFKHPYKHDNEIDFEYSHISFYKVENYTDISYNGINEIESGLSLNGLLSSVNSKIKHSEYRTGYGTKNVFNEDKLLPKTSKNINELAFNSKNHGKNAYTKNRVIGTNMELRGENIEKLYEKSHWVTFIEPNFGVEYFNTNDDNLIIIHYSDQNNSYTKYDTITVTNRNNQYMDIIKNFLETTNPTFSSSGISNIIKIFNCINGKWLLQLIYKNMDFCREKLSIISAMKYCLAILNHEDIIWIPISLAEILRIAGNVGLSKSGGIFDNRLKGKHSDDLLFIGLKFDSNSSINAFFYPIEVKIGKPDKEKAKEQLDNTYNDLKREIRQINNEGFEFRNKFMRNFFIQILLANEKKLVSNHIWDEKKLDMIEKIKPQLLNDEFNISYALEKFIGKGAIICFETDAYNDSLDLDSKRLIITLPEEKAWSGLNKSIEDINYEVHAQGSDLGAHDLLSSEDLSNLNFNIEHYDKKEEHYRPDDSYDISLDDEDTDFGFSNIEDSNDFNDYLSLEDIDKEYSDSHSDINNDEFIYSDEDDNSSDFENMDEKYFDLPNDIKNDGFIDADEDDDSSDIKDIDEEAVSIFHQFIKENQGKYISKEDEKFVVSRVIKGKRKIFGKFTLLEYAQDYEYKLMINSWDETFKTKHISPYGKYIHKHNTQFIVERKIKGEIKNFGTFDTIEKAIKRREELIDTNWGTDGEISLSKTSTYGKYIHLNNGVFRVQKTIDGEPLIFGLFDTLNEATIARSILIENGWDDTKVPESLYSWRYFTSYYPLLDGWEVSNLIGIDLISFGIFSTTENAKLAIRILIANNWDTSYVPLNLYHENSNIRKFKRSKRTIYSVIRRVNDEFIRYGSFNTYEDALNRRNKLLMSNWIIEEIEEKIEEFIYHKDGRYFVKNEIDGVMRTFGDFYELKDAINFRLKCIKSKWNLPSDIDEYNENLSDSEYFELDNSLNEELNSDISSIDEYLKDYDFSIKSKKS